ncbi:DNA replication protein [Pantoea sp. B9002]|uniref:replication protein P n=1 Tax=Pantoea sp. B9002 TaxID=2726979 RepID=UPI0015A28A5C|nr:replication protein P [Pantoea sp. B9002]NWA63006.1 DNA replication protein [Pantoea sp. B9002]
MRHLVQAIQNRDAGALAAMTPAEQPKQAVPQQAIQIFNELFRQLKAAFPALSASIKEQEDLNELRRQWVLAFAENGINSMEQVNAGMKIARQQAIPFLPSPGQFVAWCKQGENRAAGLPSDEDLYDMFRLYCRDRGMYDLSDNYPWQSPACFHMITAVHNQMQSFNLSDAECRKRLGEELRRMSRRIESGETIPPPRKQIPKLSIPSTPKKALEGIALLKSTLKSKGKSS